MHPKRQHSILLLRLDLFCRPHSSLVVAFLVVDIACLAVVHNILEVVHTGCKDSRIDHSLEEDRSHPEIPVDHMDLLVLHHIVAALAAETWDSLVVDPKVHCICFGLPSRLSSRLNFCIEEDELVG